MHILMAQHSNTRAVWKYVEICIPQKVFHLRDLTEYFDIKWCFVYILVNWKKTKHMARLRSHSPLFPHPLGYMQNDYI
jgi:hypothetical protein